MLRWHPDKFEGMMLGKVAEGGRGVVKEAAGRLAHSWVYEHRKDDWLAKFDDISIARELV
jgi:hypothetical protein